MKAYVAATGVLFLLLVAVHIWRAVEEGSRVAKEPFFVIATLVTGGLSLWALWLLRSARRA